MIDQLTNIQKSAEMLSDASSADNIHDVRIEAKQLRYSLEYFTPLFKKKTISPIISELKRQQTALGEFNDTCIQLSFLHNFMQESHKPKCERALGQLILHLEKQQKDEVSNAINDIKRFCRPQNIAKYQSLILK